MSRPTRLERVKGTNDVLPPTAKHERAVEDRLLSLFASYGYRFISVPVLEHTDLYLRKAGEDTLARLYSFTYQNRKLSLRPELTASVVRAYVEHLQTAPLPVATMSSMRSGPVCTNCPATSSSAPSNTSPTLNSGSAVKHSNTPRRP